MLNKRVRKIWLALAALIVLVAIGAVALHLRKNHTPPAVLVVGGWDQSAPLLDSLSKQKKIPLRSLPQGEMETADFESRLASAGFILVLNAPTEHLHQFETALRRAHDRGVRIIALDARPWQGAMEASGILERDDTLSRYWRFSDEKNLSYMLDYVGAKYLGQRHDVHPPEPSPTEGIYHPDSAKVFTDVGAFEQWYRGAQRVPDAAPKVAYVVHSRFVFLKNTEDIDALIHALERHGIGVYTVFAEQEAALRKMLQVVHPDVLMTQRHTGLGRPADGSAPIPMLMGVPYLKPISALRTTIDEWKSAPEGLRPGDLAGQVTAQELEGTIEPILISAQKTAGEYRIQTPIDERIEHFAERAASWIRLQRTPNNEKRVAVIYYNTELDGDSLARGSVSGMFLNGPESLLALTRAMRDKGYRLTPPADRDALLKSLSTQGRNYGPWAQASIDELASREGVVLVKVSDYLQWFEKDLTDSQRESVIRAHGQPPGKLMLTSIHGEPEFVIPQVPLGPGVSLFPQPEKGARQDARLVHDQTVPPSHQYIAFYLWLREVYRPDALVHFGTHGSLELLPRRAAGMGPDDFADALLGPMPNINPWILDNVAEATLARRRAYAVLVGHLVPAIERTEVPEPLLRLHRDSQKALNIEAGPVRDAFLRKIEQDMRSQKFALDLLGTDPSKGQLSEEKLKELSFRLHEVQEEQAPRSLHVLGQPPSDERRPGYITSILGRDFVEHAGGRDKAEKLVRCVTIDSKSEDECCTALGLSVPEQSKSIKLAVRLNTDLLKATDEISRLLGALEGRYVPPGPGNDPVRNLNALPSGRNIYALDPEEVPSAPAMEVAKVLATQLVEEYQHKHGRAPRKVAINLNGFETMRDTGVTEAQVLWLLGVEPIRNERGLVTEVKLIDREKLGRPRVDVFVAISGAYRDNFPTRVKLLDRAIRLAQSSPEEDNPLAQSLKSDVEELKKKGLDAKEAEKLGRVRIYGQAPGQYGTQLLYLLPRSGAWEQRSEVAQVYRENMRFAYGEEVWGERSEEGFGQAMSGTEAVSHVWSSNMMSPLTNHHVYEYLGGLSMAVEQQTGKKPDSLIADARDPARGRTRDLAEVLSTELATRLLNERWIEDMEKSGYAGAGHVSAYVENLFGWATTTPGSVDPSAFAQVEEIYLRDSKKLGTRKWLEEGNPDALASVTATLLESARRGYWAPSAEVRDRLTADYMAQVASRGEPTGMMAGGNESLRTYVQKTYQAEGSRVPAGVRAAYEQKLRGTRDAERAARESIQTASANTQVSTERPANVEGQVIQKVKTEPLRNRWVQLSAVLAAIAVVGAGIGAGVRSLRARPRNHTGGRR